ncbi:hypothetical protein [Bacteroides sp.]|uniref:hypothetical protein n=1 Tax=Bacteroides sp. TaxID=29523 RepID=UPI0025B926C1|nr:hypothetical protein [Bacteroides sp.]
MKKQLTLSIAIIFAVLCFQSCGNEEYDSPEDEHTNVSDKNSNIDFDGKTYCTWIKDTSYYIGIYDLGTQDKIVEIPTVIEGGLNQTADLSYGIKQNYTIKGCYILDIKKNKNGIYLLLEYSEYKYGLGITEIIHLRNNNIVKRIKYANGRGRPNILINWYDEEIIAVANVNLSEYSTWDIFFYKNDLSQIYKGIYSKNIDILLNSFPIDTFSMLYIEGNRILLYNIPDMDIIWNYRYDEVFDIHIKQKKVETIGNTASFRIDVVYKDGSTAIRSFKLNLNDGSLIE